MSGHPFRHGSFRPEDLRRVQPAPAPDCPPLGIGDWCRLNSGSPRLLVVDLEADNRVVVSLPDGTEERLVRAVVRRCA